jgi:dTMP kinase
MSSLFSTALDRAMENGFLIVVEGLDGTGKSSVVRKLARILNESGNLPGAVKLTFEPHDPSACGVYIRQALMHRIKVPPHTLALAFAVNRADHCLRDIGPFLKQTGSRGRIVICDRYYLSSLVYQSSESVSMERIMRINEAAIRPDLTIFLNATDRTCYSRMRMREQPRELFEFNLRATRKKYLEAIDFLKQRGEKVVEVSAEGSLGEVVIRVLNAILAHAPSWLRVQVQPPLLVEEEPEGFEEQEMHIQTIADEIQKCWDIGPLMGVDDLNCRLNDIRKEADSIVSALNYSGLANVFLDLLRQRGYTVVGRLPWTDVDAVELSFTMPFGIVQRGAALFMGDTQRYDIVLPNILGGEKVEMLRRMSDFLLILDSNPSVLHSKYYERDAISYRNTADASPSVAIFGPENIRAAVVARAARAFYEEYSRSIRALPNCVPALKESLAVAEAAQSPCVSGSA